MQESLTKQNILQNVKMLWFHQDFEILVKYVKTGIVSRFQDCAQNFKIKAIMDSDWDKEI